MFKILGYLSLILFVTFTAPAVSTAEEAPKKIEKTYNLDKKERVVKQGQIVDQVSEMLLFDLKKELAVKVLESLNNDNFSSKISKDMLVTQIRNILTVTRKTVETLEKDKDKLISMNVSFVIDFEKFKEYIKLIDVRNDMFINLRDLTSYYKNVDDALSKSTPENYKEILNKLVMEDENYRLNYKLILQALDDSIVKFKENTERKQKELAAKNERNIKLKNDLLDEDNKTDATIKAIDNDTLRISEIRRFEVNKVVNEGMLKKYSLNLTNDNPIDKAIIESNDLRKEYHIIKDRIDEINAEYYSQLEKIFTKKKESVLESSLSKEEKKEATKSLNKEYKDILKEKNYHVYNSYYLGLRNYVDMLNIYQNNDYIYAKSLDDVRVTVLKPNYEKKEIKILYGLFGKKYEQVYNFSHIEKDMPVIYKNKDFIKAVPVYSLTNSGKKNKKEIKGFRVFYTGKYTEDGNFIDIKTVAIRDVKPFSEVDDFKKITKKYEEYKLEFKK